MKYLCVRCHLAPVRTDGEMCPDCAKQKELPIKNKDIEPNANVDVNKRLAKLNEATQDKRTEKGSYKQSCSGLEYGE